MVDIGLSKDALRALIPLSGEFVGTTDTQTLTNKTISSSSNTLTSTSIATGDILKGYTDDHYGRLARGTANQALVTNNGATDINWGTVQVQGGGTGVATHTAGVLVSSGGTTALSTKTNPTGAFLGDSDTQNITGAKTFTDQRLKLRNPAGTFTMTVVNPAITADQDYRFNGPYEYFIFKSGSTYYAKNGTTKTITSSNSDASTLIQAAVTATLASSRGGTILFSADDFVIETPIDIPTATVPKPLTLIGMRSHTRDKGTSFTIGTTFSTNRYIFETSGATDASTKWAVLTMRGLQAYNPQFATINAGFLKFESDNASYYRTLVLEQIWLQYFWRGIHLLGAVWYSHLHDLRFLDANSSFVGDADIKTEYNAHTTLGVNAWPKGLSISHILAFHSAGTMKNSLAMVDASYCDVTNYQIDGTKYTEAPFALTNNCEYNVFKHLMAIDMTVPTPDVRKAGIYLTGTGAFYNTFHDVHIAPYPVTVALNSGAKYNQIEIAGFWGSQSTVNDTGAGAGNVIIVQPGNQSGSVAKVTNTAGLVRTIDQRFGATTTGTAATITAGATTGVITHGCFTTPNIVRISPTSDTLGKRFWVSAKGATTFTISIDSTGASNITFDWMAEVY